MPKEEFLQRLETVFDCFTSAGDTFLYAEPGICDGLCFPRCQGFSFIGNKSNQFIHLIFEENMDNNRYFELLDIIECGSFLNYNSALKFNEKKHLHIGESHGYTTTSMPPKLLKQKSEDSLDENKDLTPD